MTGRSLANGGILAAGALVALAGLGRRRLSLAPRVRRGRHIDLSDPGAVMGSGTAIVGYAMTGHEAK